LTGRPPFVADSPAELLIAHLQEPPPPLAEARPDCPPAVVDAIMRMLAKRPDDRWPSMRDAVAALGGDHREPLGHDPDSARVLQLAQDSGERNALAQITAPSSPVPVGKVSGGGAPVTTVLHVEPQSGSLRIGGTLQLRAAVLGWTGEGNWSDPIRWSSSNARVATVGPDGLVTALGAGTASILASSCGLSGSAAISVRPM
jgi:serine/threonine protein kinase